jgi:hypothetical protein
MRISTSSAFVLPMAGGGLAFWEGYEGQLTTLLVYGVGIALFALVVHMFYKNLSRVNLLHRYDHAAEQPDRITVMLLFPLVSAGFFLTLTVSLFFLVKEASQSVETILLLSMAVTTAVRIAAYISESSAEDLAKMIPLGLLGVFLVDPGYFSFDTPLQRLAALPGVFDTVDRYLLALVAVELAMRGLWIASGGRERAARERARGSEGRRVALVEEVREGSR